MAFSFGIGYSQAYRDAGEKIKNTRLKNKEAFDKFLKNKLDRGEKVSVSDLENLKREVVGADYLQNMYLGNEAVLKEMSKAHNTAIYNQEIEKAKGNLANMTAIKNAMVDQITTNTTFDQFKANVMPYMGKDEETQIRTFTAMNFDENDFNKYRNDKRNAWVAQEINSEYFKNSVDNINDIDGMYEDAWKTKALKKLYSKTLEATRAKALATISTNQLITNMSDNDKYRLLTDEKYLKDIATLEIKRAQPGKEPTEEEIKMVANDIRMVMETNRRRIKTSAQSAFNKEFYDHPLLKPFLTGDGSMGQVPDHILEDALRQASGEALGIELDFIVDPKTGKLNAHLLSYFDGNTLTAVRMMVARKQYDAKFKEAKALTSKTAEEVFDRGAVAETATQTLNLAASAVNKDLADMEKSPFMIAVSQYFSGKYYVGPNDFGNMVTFMQKINERSKDMEDINVTKINEIVDEAAAASGFKTFSQAKNDFNVLHSNLNMGGVPPNTSLSDYAHSTINLITKGKNEFHANLQALPRDFKTAAGAWKMGEQGAKFTEKLKAYTSELYKLREDIEADMSGNNQYLFSDLLEGGLGTPTATIGGNKEVGFSNIRSALLAYIDNEIKTAYEQANKIIPQGDISVQYAVPGLAINDDPGSSTIENKLHAQTLPRDNLLLTNIVLPVPGTNNAKANDNHLFRLVSDTQTAAGFVDQQNSTLILNPDYLQRNNAGSTTPMPDGKMFFAQGDKGVAPANNDIAKAMFNIVELATEKYGIKEGTDISNSTKMNSAMNMMMSMMFYPFDRAGEQYRGNAVKGKPLYMYQNPDYVNAPILNNLQRNMSGTMEFGDRFSIGNKAFQNMNFNKFLESYIAMYVANKDALKPTK
tara:strand:+ start:20169 stop:22784 length:2616 start_codon:yes stop_codon:yes gene_type:complete